jgi:hypothetical protein
MALTVLTFLTEMPLTALLVLTDLALGDDDDDDDDDDDV